MGRRKKDGVKVTYYINRRVSEAISLFCEETGLSKTAAIERGMIEYIDAQKRRSNRNSGSRTSANEKGIPDEQ